jgi:radical SAM superfamily enzyme YgiQ (UPF0313 family)
MNTAVLISPRSGDGTLYGLQGAMRYVRPNEFGGKKAAFEPYGLLVVGGQLKKHYDKIDLIDRNIVTGPLENIQKVRDAAQVFIGANSYQRKDCIDAINSLHQIGKQVIVGGRIVDEQFIAETHADRYVRGEVESIVEQLWDDINNGQERKVYIASHVPAEKFGLPDHTLINPRDYVGLSLQFSKGCVYDCEFCNEHTIDGKVIRAATTSYIKEALKGLYATGHRGTVFVVDDNYAAKPHETIRFCKAIVEVENELGIHLPKINQMSMNVTNNSRIMKEVRYWLRQAGFVSTFLGIESTIPEVVESADKGQNNQGNESLETKLGRLISETGMSIKAGVIVGFDKHTLEMIEQEKKGFNSLPIPMLLPGVLNALDETALKTRLIEEGRYRAISDNTNSDGTINFVSYNISPKDLEQKVFPDVLRTFYTPKAFFKRLNGMLGGLNPRQLTNDRSWQNSLYSVRKILFSGPNKATYWSHIPSGTLNVLKNIWRHKADYKPANWKHIPDSVSRMVKRILYLEGELFTNFAQFSHFKDVLDNVEKQAKKRPYQEWKQKSWMQVLAEKMAIPTK